jgi:hypothetical protein
MSAALRLPPCGLGWRTTSFLDEPGSTMCVRASLAGMGEASPRVVDDGWGFVEVEGLGRFRDVKLWPGGGRAWDWRETGTDQRPAFFAQT